MSPAEPLRETVVRVEAPRDRFHLLLTPEGDFLGADDADGLVVLREADDRVLWDEVPGGYRHAATRQHVTVAPVADGERVVTSRGCAAGSDGRLAATPLRLRPVRGPSRLPSEYLREFRRQGWVCLAAVLDPDTVDGLQRVAGCGRWSGGDYDRNVSALEQHAAVARASAEPVSLWLTRQYMGTDEIRFAHPPSFAVLDRDDGERDVQGWHSDFPYLWGIDRRVGGGRIPTGQTGDLVLGIQRNICATDFTRSNGATRFKLGSHRHNAGPPAEWGLGVDYRRPGHRKRHGLPYGGPDADVIEAPAGSILLYDARTWHRAGLNETDTRRAAVLQAVTPPYIMPFADSGAAFKAFSKSGPWQEITDRERRELESLMVYEIVGPRGRQAITVDPELTGRRRAGAAASAP